MVALTKQKFLPLLIKAITPLRPTSKRLYVIAEIKKILPEKQLFPSYNMEIKGKLEDVIDDLREELWWSSVKSGNSRHIQTGVNFQFLLLHVQHFHPPVRRTV